MKTVECKSEVRDVTLLESILRRRGATFIAELGQRDTYFRIPDARLLRREHHDGPPEWLFYTRRHVAKPRLCSATCYSEAAARERFGAAPLPGWVTIEKRRRTWWRNGLRVNIDDLGPLGRFVEFETRIGARGDAEACHARIVDARREFHPFLGEPIAVGYAELAVHAIEAEADARRLGSGRA